ncbi:hypothetical protein BDW02DRAFT_649110 [Decorospora gaudefroyi]|uniref:DUF6590 domain-containing protein n=1 Tax=Decorospora gaudefroyi TaxID=184978 RepID=A0A6A5K447_9PLEO|nr:hypothetical protein BDW02DRAFT_649110 [Decorospora gaudefroyi]
MSTLTPWTWSIEYNRYYKYRLGLDGTVLETLWAGPADPRETTASSSIVDDPRTPRSSNSQTTYNAQESRNLSQSSPPMTYSTANGQTDSNYVPSTTPSTTPSYSVSNSNALANSHYQNPVGSSSNTGYQNPRNFQEGSATQPGNNTAGYMPVVPPSSSPPANRPAQLLNQYYPAYQPGTAAASSNNPRSHYASLPLDVQNDLGGRDQRFIRTGSMVVGENSTEPLDPRYRRVSPNSHVRFYVPGRVFKMLWIEPAGIQSPGKTRGSTHYSYTVKYGEQAYCEIRRFVVVRNRGTFSQCIPIQTYRGQGATKRGLIIADHGIIHTSEQAPGLLPGEYITKSSIRVEATGNETLHPASRINYGKPYAVEHNVKVLDIGMVTEGHRYLIPAYFQMAMQGQ